MNLTDRIPMANKPGRSRTSARIKSARQQKTVPEILPRHKQEVEYSIQQFQSAVFHNASRALLVSDRLRSSEHELTTQASNYLRMLVYGPIVEAEVARLDHTARRIAEQRFATACWFKRHRSSGHQLPGMSNSYYADDYARARKLFPRN